MRIAVFGASGRTGQCVLREGLAAGHDMIAIVRDPSQLSVKGENLSVVQSDVRDPISVQSAMRGADAVICAIAPKSRGPTTVHADAARNLLAAMEKQGVGRLICVSSIGVGDSRGGGGWLFSRIVLPFFLSAVFRDKEEQERIIRESPLDWTLVRPMRLTNQAVGKHWRVSGTLKGEDVANRLSRQSLAAFLIELAVGQGYLRKAIVVGS